MRRNNLAVAATLLAVLAALYVLIGPTISGSISEYDDQGKLIRQLKGPLSPWRVGGSWALLTLLPPVALAFASLFAAWSRRSARPRVLVSATLMLAYCVVNLLSGGLGPLPAATGVYFLPASLLMLKVGLVGDRSEAVMEERLHESV